MDLKCVILAAGEGNRLRPETNDRMKALVEVNGRPLLYYLVKNSVEYGIRDFVIVGGYRIDVLRKWIEGSRSAFPGAQFTLVDNAEYAQFNNCYSFKRGIEDLDSSIILFNSDIIIDKRIIGKAVESSGNTLVIDNVKELGAEEMKAVLKEGAVVSLSKQNDPASSAGEYIGVTRIERESLKMVKESFEGFDFENGKKYYEDLLMDSNRFGVRFSPLFTEGMHWTEIDTLEDLSFARNNIFQSLNKDGFI